MCPRNQVVQANAEVAPVNDRMPLVLTSESQYARWLDPEITTRDPLKTAMQAIGDGVLLCHGSIPMRLRKLSGTEHPAA